MESDNQTEEVCKEVEKFCTDIAFTTPGELRARNTFLESRLDELREMLRHRSVELIEARSRIEHLERCLGRMYVEKE